jgi:hypothetical protein
LATGCKCCGRRAFSQGNLEEATRLGQHNLALLSQDVDNAPILFLEPSCYSMFAEDYRELKLEGAEQVAQRCFIFEQFVEDLLSHEPAALRFKPRAAHVIIHAHCHAKALMNPSFMKRLVERLPERGSLCSTPAVAEWPAPGAPRRYELSLASPSHWCKSSVASRSAPWWASGTSCRHQITPLAPVRAGTWRRFGGCLA